MTPFLGLSALTPLAHAHEPGLSAARIDGESLSLTFAAREVSLMGGEPALSAAAGQVSLSVNGAPCSIGAGTVSPVEGDGLTLTAPIDCPSGTEWSYSAPMLSSLSPGHRQVLEAFGQSVAVLDAGSPSATFTGQEDAASVAGRFVGLGVEHIWTGFDHLAFLLALVLAARSLKEMLWIVTGFTLSHSITLSLAATGVVTLPSSFVEPAIAATIIYAGVENLWQPSARRRIALTFALGFIHGFGFAGLLQELGLPREHLFTALLSFNGGVEIGQAAVVSVVLPLLLLARRWSWWIPRAVPAASLAVAAAGVFWLVQRVSQMFA